MNDNSQRADKKVVRSLAVVKVLAMREIVRPLLPRCDALCRQL